MGAAPESQVEFFGLSPGLLSRPQLSSVTWGQAAGRRHVDRSSPCGCLVGKGAGPRVKQLWEDASTGQLPWTPTWVMGRLLGRGRGLWQLGLTP